MITVTYLSPLRVRRQACSSTPRTSTPSKRRGSSTTVCSARARIAVLAVCQDIPRARAARETDMDSSPRASSPHFTAERVRRARGSTRVEVSRHRARWQEVQAKRHRRTTSPVGRQATGTCAKRRTTVPRDSPRAPQDR